MLCSLLVASPPVDLSLSIQHLTCLTATSVQLLLPPSQTLHSVNDLQANMEQLSTNTLKVYFSHIFIFTVSFLFVAFISTDLHEICPSLLSVSLNSNRLTSLDGLMNCHQIWNINASGNLIESISKHLPRRIRR